MPTLTTLISVLALTLLLPVLANAEEEIPSDLQEVRAVPKAGHIPPSGASVEALVAEAANPRVPQDVAAVRFQEIVRRGTSVSPTLAQIFADPKRSDLEVWVAARALGRIGGEDARRALETGLKSKRIMSRLGSASGLGLAGDGKALPALEAALHDKAMMVRAAAADALGVLRQPASADALGKALNNPANFRGGQSLFVRKHIVDAIGMVGSRTSLELLVASVADTDPAVQLSARNALTKITGKNFGKGSAVSAEEAEAWKDWWRSGSR